MHVLRSRCRAPWPVPLVLAVILTAIGQPGGIVSYLGAQPLPASPVRVELSADNATWLDDAAAESRLLEGVYDARGGQLAKQKDWPAMADLYGKALERHRGDPRLAKHFERNAMAAYDSWTKPLMASKSWAEAVSVYEKALARFPDNKHLEKNLRYCKQQQSK